MIEHMTDPVVIGVLAAVVFEAFKKMGLLDWTVDEVRFVLVVLFAGVAGGLSTEGLGVVAKFAAGGEAAAAAVFAYNGWKQLVTRVFGKWFGMIDAIEAIDREVLRLRDKERDQTDGD